MDGTISFSAFSAATMDFLRFVMDHSGSRRRKRIRENKDTGVAVSYFCYYYRHFHGNVFKFLRLHKMKKENTRKGQVQENCSWPFFILAICVKEMIMSGFGGE